MDQASGGEDPNKPSKKKSSEDESKNKKLVGIPGNSPCFTRYCVNHEVPQVGIICTFHKDGESCTEDFAEKFHYPTF